MKRLFYVTFGAVTGVLIVRRVSTAASKWTPAGLTDQASGVGGKISDWWGIVQTSAAARERELRSALGIDDDREQPAA